MRSDYSVPIKGLSTERELYKLRVKSDLFSSYEESEVISADVEVEISIEKKIGVIELIVSFEGEVVTACDRCLGEMEVELEFKEPLFIKFVKEEGEEEESDDVLVVNEKEDEVDLSQFLYDHISLALPLQRIHPEGECDKQMIEKLRSHSFLAETKGEKNTPFSNLNELIN